MDHARQRIRHNKIQFESVCGGLHANVLKSTRASSKTTTLLKNTFVRFFLLHLFSLTTEKFFASDIVLVVSVSAHRFNLHINGWLFFVLICKNETGKEQNQVIQEQCNSGIVKYYSRFSSCCR
ncbi:hypothetical protein GWI33_019951 [Rhynchophorus ferrugineus]|uniref:Uncharacterized protein n=1 Tax=Rhynchophorus ferrugineus TaxID=354439 RepID=A0A834HTD4_RHYFE|nr:hypothetical protein GWI33_019951 [Rhynchophorus ferrugineus]